MCEAMDVIVQKIENKGIRKGEASGIRKGCLLYTSPSPRDGHKSRMPSSA